VKQLPALLAVARAGAGTLRRAHSDVQGARLGRSTSCKEHTALRWRVRTAGGRRPLTRAAPPRRAGAGGGRRRHGRRPVCGDGAGAHPGPAGRHAGRRPLPHAAGVPVAGARAQPAPPAFWLSARIAAVSRRPATHARPAVPALLHDTCAWCIGILAQRGTQCLPPPQGRAGPSGQGPLSPASPKSDAGA